MSTFSSSFLRILRHESLATEKVSQNGLLYDAHVVVKYLPFKIVLGFSEDMSQRSLLSNTLGNTNVNFKSFRLDAKLVYDNPELTEVPFVRVKPIEYTTEVNDQGTKIDVDIKLKVSYVTAFYKVGFSPTLFPANPCFHINKLDLCHQNKCLFFSFVQWNTLSFGIRANSLGSCLLLTSSLLL
jgi:hypothetical protein